MQVGDEMLPRYHNQDLDQTAVIRMWRSCWTPCLFGQIVPHIDSPEASL